MKKFEIESKSAKNAFDLLDYKKEGVINIQEVLNNMVKLGFDKTHPEALDLVESLGNNTITYKDFMKNLSELMNQKEEDTGLQRMYDLLIFDPKAQNIDRTLLKRIAIETGNPLNDFEITYLLNRAGNGKTITLESFIDFMNN